MKLRRQKRFVVRTRWAKDGRLAYCVWDTQVDDWYDDRGQVLPGLVHDRARDLNKAHRKGWAL